MKVIIETRYCDGCGRGPNPSGNVPYLGWVFIDVPVQGTIGTANLTADLCHFCRVRVQEKISTLGSNDD
jgi:hypothetical protein